MITGWLTLAQVFLDSLRFSQEIWRVLTREFDKFLKRFHRNSKFLSEFLMFLIRPRIAQGGEAGVKHAHSIFEFAVEPLQFIGEAPHLFGVHYCLGHIFAFR